ncbi:HEAT repeat domain-containing protein [Pseudenhygromyxa sp. WMMC2535]|uniref:HEAT repeat domain-containing protein n=1 Tax=Pseudenhygromyxa sp. WMMC2535 TaxID=2712867 RepID=UPI0015542E28|nr:HEAT repeat domain-containing protein [Pseudenhygromyxa sp. WMMC2535]
MKSTIVKAGVATTLALTSIVAVAVAYGRPRQAESKPRAAVTTAAAPAAPGCHFEPGDRAAFVLQSAVRDVRSEETDHLRATLSWELAEQLSSDRWRLRAALSDLSHSQTMTLPEERVSGSLAEPFFVDVDASCRLVDFGFVSEWDVRRRRLVQTALRAHEFVTPTAARGETWSANQVDGLGSFEARYALAAKRERRGLRIDRHKTAYDQSGEAFGISIAVVHSEATAHFDSPRSQWLRDASGLERVQLRIHGEIAADLAQHFSLVRDDDRFVPVPALAVADADFRDLADLEIERERMVDAEMADVAYAEALDAFLGRFAADADAELGDPSYAAARELAAWIRNHEDGPQLLADALRDGSIDAAARPALFLALELSGTDAARGTLSELLVDPRLDSFDRARAASALADIGEPSLDTASLLFAQTQGQADPIVANVSVLGLGSMAKRSGDGEVRSFVQESLDGALNAALDEGEARVLLDAMGNSGDVAFADTLESHLEAESPATRQHAAKALGRLDPAEAGPRLLQRLGDESDPAVGAAIVSAYRGPASANAIATMSARLEHSSSVSERAAIIHWLGNASLSEPAAQRKLVAHVGRERNAQLLQQIGSYIPAAEM